MLDPLPKTLRFEASFGMPSVNATAERGETARAEPAETVRYQYDAEDVVAEYDAAGALRATYVFGPGIDEPLKVRRGGIVAAFHGDGLGSIVAITDADDASSLATYSYDAFGALTGGSGEFPNAYTFTGRERDATGLLYYRARYYLPAIGRFLSPDPTGLRGGTNPYSYVAANPVNFTDPFGLAAGLASFNAIAPPPPPVLGVGDSLWSGSEPDLDWAVPRGGEIASSVLGSEGVAPVGGPLGLGSGIPQSNVPNRERPAVDLGIAQGNPVPGLFNPVDDRFPPPPRTGTEARLGYLYGSLFGATYQRGVAYATDARGNRAVYAIKAVGGASEIIEVGYAYGRQVTNAAHVLDLRGESTSLGFGGTYIVIGGQVEFNIGKNYEGRTYQFFGGAGLSPVSITGLAEWWEPEAYYPVRAKP